MVCTSSSGIQSEIILPQLVKERSKNHARTKFNRLFFIQFTAEISKCAVEKLGPDIADLTLVIVTWHSLSSKGKMLEVHNGELPL